MLISGLIVFVLGFIGIIINYKSLIHLVLCLELILIGITQVLLYTSYHFNDIDGTLLSIYLITIAGCESAIALALIIKIYQIRGLCSFNLN